MLGIVLRLLLHRPNMYCFCCKKNKREGNLKRKNQKKGETTRRHKVAKEK